MVVAATAALVGDREPGRTPAERPAAHPEAGGSLSAVGPLRRPRAVHTATLLADGSVLLAGGCSRDGCEGVERATEVYEPGRGRFRVGASMLAPRDGHSATRLRGGRVLVAGGWSAEGTDPLASAELYLPARGRFRAAGRLATPRGAQLAVALRDGRALIAGGTDGDRPLAAAELYDPAAGRFRDAPPMRRPRVAAAATVLGDGRVLVTGGSADGTTAIAASELFDPRTGRWSAAGDLGTARMKHAATALADGRVLVAGGAGSDDFDDRLASAEVYDPATNRFSPVAPMTSTRFKLPAAVSAAGAGGAVVAGGASRPEFFDARTDRFRRARGPALRGYLFSTATALRDGRVLVAGGYDDGIAVQRGAYLYAPPAT